MIGNGCPYADSKVLIKRVREHLLPTAQLRGLWRPGSTVATPGAGDRHIDLLCYLTQVRPLSRRSKICAVQAG